MKRVPAETPQWRWKFDRAAHVASCGRVGRLRVFRSPTGTWFFGPTRERAS